MAGGEGFAQYLGGGVDPAVRILQPAVPQPLQVGFQDQCRVVQLSRQARMPLKRSGQRRKPLRRQFLALKLAQQQVQLLGKSREPGCRVKDLQARLVAAQQGTKRHDTALFLKHRTRRRRKFVQNESCQPVERKNLQARVTMQRRSGEQLTFELKRGLLGREQQQWRTLRRLAQGLPNLRQATERLSAAGRPEEKPDLHAPVFHRKPPGRKGIMPRPTSRAPAE